MSRQEMISVEFTVHMKPFSIGTRYPLAADLARELLKTGEVKDPYEWVGPVSDEKYQAKMAARAKRSSSQQDQTELGPKTDKQKRKAMKTAYLQGL